MKSEAERALERIFTEATDADRIMRALTEPAPAPPWWHTWREITEQAPAGAEAPALETPSAYVFRRDGAIWRIVYAGQQAPALKDSRGMALIHALLRHPYQDFSALELENLASGRARWSHAQADQNASEALADLRAEDGALHTFSLLEDGAPLEATDAETLRAVREQMARASEASNNQNLPDAERALERERLQKCQQYLAYNASKRGAPRCEDKQAKNARDRVRANVKNALDAIFTQAPALFEHLYSAGIGAFTSGRMAYRPAEPHRWRLE